MDEYEFRRIHYVGRRISVAVRKTDHRPESPTYLPTIAPFMEDIKRRDVLGRSDSAYMGIVPCTYVVNGKSLWTSTFEVYTNYKKTWHRGDSDPWRYTKFHASKGFVWRCIGEGDAYYDWATGALRRQDDKWVWEWKDIDTLMREVEEEERRTER